MVYILKLELKGFKSFRDHTTLEFTKGFNAITGKNGSGKSNILDAIRFALGSNSPKSLRESRMSRLINEGSRNKFARVSITLSNENGSIPVNSEKVTITRELMEDGTQRYFLNGKRITKNAIEDLLAAASISSDGLNIVPQGSLNTIADMSPSDRMQLLQEIIGIKMYDEKKAEALQRLKEADEQLAVTFAKMDEKREVMVKLETEMNELLRLNLINVEIERYRKAVLLKRLAEISEEKEKLIRSIDETQKKSDTLSKELDGLIKMLEGGESSRKFYEEYADAKSRLNSILSELHYIDLNVNSYLEEAKKASSALSELKEMMKSLTNAEASLQTEIASTQKELEKLNRELLQLNEEISNLEDKKDSIIKLINEKDSYQRRLSSAIERLINARIRIEKNLEYLKEMLTNEKQRLESYETLLRAHEELKSKIESIHFNMNSKETTEYISMLEELKKRRQEMINEIIKANDVLVKAIGYATAHKILKNIKEKDYEGEILDAGLFEGYLGRLSDIIRPKAGYEHLVKSVLEFLKDPLIFSSFNEKTLAFLKNSGRKRAVFISEITKNHPCEGSIIKYIEFPEKYKELVEYIFGRICISKEDCCEVFVLKDGTIIYNGMYEIGQINALKLDLNNYEKKLNRIKESINKLTEVLSRRTQTIAEISNKILELKQKTAMKKDEHFENQIIKEIEDAIKSEEEALQKYIQEFKELKNMLEKKASEISKYENTILKINEKVEMIRNKLKKAESLDLSTSEVETKLNESLKNKEKLEFMILEKKNKLNELNLSLSSLKEKINATSNSIVELEKKIEYYKNKISELSNRKEFLDKEKKELEFYLKDLEPRVKMLSETETSKEQLSKEKDKLLKEIKDFNRKVEKLKVELDTLISEENRLKEEIDSIKYEPYELVGDYETLISGLKDEKDYLETRVNRMAEKDYTDYYRSYKEASNRRNELEKDRDAILKFIEDIEKQKKEAFIKSFEQIDKRLREIFKQIVDGNAWLELENPDNPFDGGVFLIGQLGDKQPRESASLSGGEKAVLSVAFLMAIQSSYPANFYIFDEIDANLDAESAERVGNFLKKWSMSSQIILISLKDTMLSKADKVFGVYEREGVSKVIPLEMSKVSNEQQ
ncbi:MAG: chromosome segregation SMC family protein [Nitrososphaeria archaeon]